MKKNNRGSLLVMSLAVIFIVGGMVVSVLTLSTAGVKRERGLEHKFKSREIAEAGLDVALNELRKATDGVDNDGDGTIDEGLNAQSGPFGYYTPSGVVQVEGNLGRLGTVNWTPAYDVNQNGLPDFFEPGVAPIAFAGGRFIVWTIFSEADGIDNNGDGTIDEAAEAGSLTAIAMSEYGNLTAQARFSGIFTESLAPPNPPVWNPNAAIGVGGDLTVTGHAIVTGASGNVHANDYLDVQGASSISGNATSSGGIYVHKSSNVGTPDPVNPGQMLPGTGQINGTAGLMGIPDVRPELMRPLANYILTKTGQVTNSSGIVVALPGNFSFNSADQSWHISGKANLNGTYYVEGGLKLTPGGSVHDIQTATFIVEKNVEAAANQHYLPHTGDMWLIAGGDIHISGNPDLDSPALVIAREQIFISGNPNLKGVVMGADLDDVETTVTENRITGSMTVLYNGGLTTNIPVVVPSTKYVLDPTFSAYEER